MKCIGYIIQNIGYKLMPISFISYFILKIIEFKWKKKGYSKLVKSL